MGEEYRVGSKLAYVCDGGRRLGLGHVSRGRALLAHADGCLVVGGGYAEISAMFSALSVTPWLDPRTPFEPGGIDADLVIVDHYAVSEDWIAAVSEKAVVAIIDDWTRPKTRAPFIVNPNIGASANYYAEAGRSTCLCGAPYALIRPGLAPEGEPRRAGRRGEGTVAVTLGGGDSKLDWREVVDAIGAQAGSEIASVDVILGPAASSTSEGGANGDARVTLRHAPEDFADICRHADVVVCSASTTSHEMAYLGVPFVPVVTADNQDRIGRGWEEAGVAPYLSIDEPEFRQRIGDEVRLLLSDRIERKRRVGLGRILVDGRGPERVLRMLPRAVASSRDQRP